MKVNLYLPSVGYLEPGPNRSLLFNSSNIIFVSVWFSRALHRKRWGSLSSAKQLSSTTFFPWSLHISHRPCQWILISAQMLKWIFISLHTEAIYKQRSTSSPGHWWNDWWCIYTKIREKKYSSSSDHCWWASIVTHLHKYIIYSFLIFHTFV